MDRSTPGKLSYHRNCCKIPENAIGQICDQRGTLRQYIHSIHPYCHCGSDKIVFVGFGGGLTWGAMVVEWTGPIPAKKHVRPEQYRLFARLRSFVRRAIRFIEGFFSRREL
jgi:hypothetical protein